jgi:hypothetical protein
MDSFRKTSDIVTARLAEIAGLSPFISAVSPTSHNSFRGISAVFSNYVKETYPKYSSPGFELGYHAYFPGVLEAKLLLKSKTDDENAMTQLVLPNLSEVIMKAIKDSPEISRRFPNALPLRPFEAHLGCYRMAVPTYALALMKLKNDSP